MSRARLARYAMFQFRDYVVERGLITLLLVALTMGPALYVLRDTHGAGWGLGIVGHERMRRTFGEMAIPISSLAVLFAIHGLASFDRQREYFRFLFSKPVGVLAYYAQDFALRFLGVMLIASVAMVTVSVATGAPPLTGFLAYVALVWALLGGIGFLLSALTQLDGLALVLVWIVSAVTLQLEDAYPGRIPYALARALPPVDRLELARHAFVVGDATFTTADLMLTLGYGAGCFLLGLVVLRRRPLSR